MHMNDILNSRAFGQVFNNTALEMVKRQERINKMLGLSAGNEFYKGVKSMQEKVMGNTFSSANSIIHLGQAQQVWQRQMGQLASAFELSKNLENNLRHVGIRNVNEALIGAYSESLNKWNSLTTQVTASYLLGPNQALKRALGGIAYELSNQVFSNKYQELLAELITLSEELSETSIEVLEEDKVSQEAFERFQALIQSFYARAKHMPKKVRKIFDQLMYVLTMIVTIDGTYKIFFGTGNKTKTEQATNDESLVTMDQFEKFQSDIFDLLEKEFEAVGDSVMIERECIVRIKPIKNAPIIEFLPPCTFVSKLDTHHKWAYVGYKSPMDSLVQHGWVLKKYLSKPKQKETH